ncbi:MAG: DNA ligase [Comamonadaceae bacterium CG_4_9_14_3_um_filter_60_33]|nr:MAG: DNA ligase [Comamonadaceae bacterium CG2_30_59_20]PIY28845.1 MAG: DNA ligase [Comamonadaceae bacterium CG_4_10_14_3_um_filter_60_42]PJB42705.1 MAG: DNA ligase [Comamonadaceae bacterium CG_4_9_14_3_um_filter_60_33]
MTPHHFGITPLSLALLCSGLLGPGLANATTAEPMAVKAQAPAAPALMHARLWHEGDNPSAYWVSEKLDGVRAFWDGQTLRFRSGLPISAPDWFTAALPKTALDGELWLGHGRFDKLSGIVRTQVPVTADWHRVQYMLFDLPGASGTFSERAERLKDLVAQAQQPWLQAVPQQRVRSAAGLHTLLRARVKAGGEGLVLHHANALWAPGRSDALLKLKFHPDDEARVVALLPGKGKHTGRMGALLLEMPDGKRFSLGTGFTNAQRADPPPVGSVVTYRYRGITPKGLPRSASFLRVQPQF